MDRDQHQSETERGASRFPTRWAWGVCLALASCTQDVAEPGPPSIFLLTVDTLRADHLGCYGYEQDVSPNIDALAEAGIRLDNAIAPRPLTGPSMASTLTGLYAHHHGVRQNFTQLHDSLDTLAEYLDVRGYSSAAFVSNYVLIEEVANLHQGFDLFDDQLPDKEPNRESYERRAQETVDAALTWLAAQTGEAPLLMWLHLIDPHGPYTPPEGYAERFKEGPTRQLRRGQIPDYQYLDTVDERTYLSRYDGEIAYCDEQLGRLLDGIRERDMWDDSVVVFHSDHGESLGEHGAWFRHGQDLFEPCTRIPLLLKLPGGERAGTHTDALVSVLDITPTLLELAGLSEPPTLDGASLLGDLELEREGLFLERKRARGFTSVGLRTAEDLLVLHFKPGSDESIAQEFYGVRDGVETPLSGDDLQGLRESTLAGLLEQVRAVKLPFEPLKVDPTDPDVQLSRQDRAQHLEAMRGLGYTNE